MTPKGTRSTAPQGDEIGVTRTGGPASRPPIDLPGPSAPWVPVLMFSFLGLGVLMILLNYLSVLPAAPSNWYLLGGLGLVLGGIFTATQYR